MKKAGKFIQWSIKRSGILGLERWRGTGRDGMMEGLQEKELFRVTTRSVPTAVLRMEGPLPGDPKCSWTCVKFADAREPSLQMTSQ